MVSILFLGVAMQMARPLPIALPSCTKTTFPAEKFRYHRYITNR